MKCIKCGSKKHRLIHRITYLTNGDVVEEIQIECKKCDHSLVVPEGMLGIINKKEPRWYHFIDSIISYLDRCIIRFIEWWMKRRRK